MLKHSASSISPILCSILNLSLSTGRIPDAWKLSRVVPVFKAGDPHAVSNYRPISMQPICGKLLEKIIHRNILRYLNTKGILTNRQFGLLPKSSTSDALTTTLHDWYGYFEDRKSVAVALFDLSKAFDKVPHSPLLLKLGAVGLSGPMHSWFRSYLSDRSQLVAVHGVTPTLFLSSLVSSRALSWAHFFSSSMWMTFVPFILPPIVRLSYMQLTPLSINLFPNHPICPTSKLKSIPSTIGSAIISLLLMLPKPSPWLFQPRRTPSLTWFCT